MTENFNELFSLYIKTVPQVQLEIKIIQNRPVSHSQSSDLKFFTMPVAKNKCFRVVVKTFNEFCAITLKAVYFFSSDTIEKRLKSFGKIKSLIFHSWSWYLEWKTIILKEFKLWSLSLIADIFSLRKPSTNLRLKSFG